MRKNFFDNVLSFLNLRQEEIQIQSDFLFEDLRLYPVIEKMDTRQDPEFIKILFSIYEELPKPLQFARGGFEESVRDPNVILNTLRLGDKSGEVIGFAKGEVHLRVINYVQKLKMKTMECTIQFS